MIFDDFGAHLGFCCLEDKGFLVIGEPESESSGAKLCQWRKQATLPATGN
jgi:hypothetical protein